MPTTSPPHDALFWATLVQAIGSVIIVVATIALVWATALLVTATKKLAEVGENTWKSGVSLKLWLDVPSGDISDPSAMVVTAVNTCAIGIRKSQLQVHACAFDPEEGEDFDLIRSDISRKVEI